MATEGISSRTEDQLAGGGAPKRPINERRLVVYLCLLAAFRVLLAIAVFPLFNNNDETYHYDYLWRVAHGDLPGPMARVSPHVLTFALVYSWPQYYTTSLEETQYGHVPPPIWLLPADVQKKALARSQAFYEDERNHETVQPPLYYAAAGAWYRVGEALRIPERVLPFWIRLLDAPMLALLVWVSYCLAKLLFGGNTFLRLGTPMLVAAVPQDLFYSISNGTLAALLCTVALYLLALLYVGKRLGYRWWAVAGLAVGAALVTSYTTSPILIVVAALVISRLVRAPKLCVLRAAWINVLVLCAAAALLPGMWAARNYAVFGAVSAWPAYLRCAHWTPIPAQNILDHPIFTSDGAVFFWTQLMAHYYRGEFTWHGVPMGHAWLDALVAWSSLLFLLIALVGVIRRGRSGGAAILMSAAMFTASVCGLIGGSIRYDFGDWLCPSRACPYFLAGRLVFGTVVPFALLYLTGLDVLLTKLRLARFKWVLLVALCVIMVESDLMLMFPAVTAKCNLLHLLTLRR